MATSPVNPDGDLLIPLESAIDNEVGTPVEVGVKKAKLVAGRVTAEKGCGPDNEEEEEETKQATVKPFEEGKEENIVPASAGANQVAEDKEAAESSDVDSELAETLI